MAQMRSVPYAMTSADIGKRKADHLDLCATDEVAFRGQTTLLECVRLIHQSLPDLHLDQIDLRVELLGRELRAPIVIAGMTGGTERARRVNRELAAIAQRRGYAFGLGSQRAMLRDPSCVDTYQVRDVAPDVLLFANLGVVQASDTSTEDLNALVNQVGANAICLHMNPAMELVQPGGDRDFSRGTETFQRCVEELCVPVIAKETGNGISRETAGKLRECGVTYIDVSGAGGTSWVGVETLRTQGDQRRLGELLWDWGVPTAASVVWSTEAGLVPIATGGIQDGLDIARAISLGARVGGIARGVYQALEREGAAGAEAFLDRMEHQLRATMLLTGAKNIEALRSAPRVILGDLKSWLDGVTP